MSYCRFGWEGSDVYIFNSEGGIECCGCNLQNNFTAGTPEEMIAHLGIHRRAGHYVPHQAVLSLWEDIPGAGSPRNPEPVMMTIASVQMEMARLQLYIEKLKQETEKQKRTDK